MASNYDVAIIGGGIFGCAIAWALSRHAGVSVVLLERHTLAAATTSRAAALLTRGRTTATLSRLVVETYDAIDHLQQQLGETLGLNRIGSLHVAESAQSLAGIRQIAEGVAALGDPVAWLSPRQAQTLAPWLAAKDALGIAHMAADAIIDPYILATAYARAAKASGRVQIDQGCAVHAILHDRHRACGVRTAQGDIAAGTVIVAAGPWVNLLTWPLGVPVATAPIRSHYWITAAAPQFPPDHPFVILPDAKAYTRPEGGGLIFGLRDQQSKWVHPQALPEDLSGLSFDDDHTGWYAMAESGAAFFKLCPSLADTPIAHYISGPSGYTPDGTYVLGRTGALDGLLVAAGCCGAGIAISGGVGQALAALVTESSPSYDLSPFDPDRFGPFDPFAEAFLERCAESRSRKTSG